MTLQVPSDEKTLPDQTYHIENQTLSRTEPIKILTTNDDVCMKDMPET